LGDGLDDGAQHQGAEQVFQGVAEVGCPVLAAFEASHEGVGQAALDVGRRCFPGFLCGFDFIGHGLFGVAQAQEVFLFLQQFDLLAQGGDVVGALCGEFRAGVALFGRGDGVIHARLGQRGHLRTGEPDLLVALAQRVDFAGQAGGAGLCGLGHGLGVGVHQGVVLGLKFGGGEGGIVE